MIKRIGPRNGGFLLSSLYLCRLTFRVIEDAPTFLVMLYVCCFVASGKFLEISLPFWTASLNSQASSQFGRTDFVDSFVCLFLSSLVQRT